MIKIIKNLLFEEINADRRLFIDLWQLAFRAVLAGALAVALAFIFSWVMKGLAMLNLANLF